MLTLTFNDLSNRLQKSNLPLNYLIKAPLTLDFNKVITLLTQFSDIDDMLYFISKISNTSGITLQIKDVPYKMGTLSDFLTVYAVNSLSPYFLSNEKTVAIQNLFNDVLLSKKQLFTLIKNIKALEFYNIILKAKCFKEVDLLSIANDYECLSGLSNKTIRTLYYYFNPKRVWKASQTPLLDMHYFSRRVGHVLGLDGYIDFKIDNHAYKIKTEGEVNAVSLHYLTEFMNAFRTRHPSTMSNTIFGAFKHSDNLIGHLRNDYKKEAPHSLFERYKKNKLIYMTLSWPHHGVGLAFYGNYVIYTNRGEGGDIKYGSKIFTLKNRALINETLFAKLTDDSLESSHEFHNILKKLVNYYNPVAKFRSKPQNHGTCTFANAKATIEPMIVLVKAGPLATYAQLQASYQAEYKRHEYKIFTNFVRDYEIDELIKDMFYASNHELLHFFAALTKTIIQQHHGKNRGFIKDKEELCRACDFFERLPDKIKRILNKDHTFIELMTKVKSDYAKLNIPERHNQSPHIQYVRYHNFSHKVNIDNEGNIVAIDGQETPKMHFSYRTVRKMISAI